MQLNISKVVLKAVSASVVVSMLQACAMSGDCVGEGNVCNEGVNVDAGTAGHGGSPAATVTANIDTDQTLVTKAGQGAGVFIEYGKNGRWHVFTACDTAKVQPASECLFNVIAYTPSGYSNVSEQSLESSDGDTLYQYEDGLELAVGTASDFDGMYFNTSPGASVKFDVYLGGVRDARFIYWVGDNAVQNGAPSDPIILRPTSP